MLVLVLVEIVLDVVLDVVLVLVEIVLDGLLGEFVAGASASAVPTRAITNTASGKKKRLNMTNHPSAEAAPLNPLEVVTVRPRLLASGPQSQMLSSSLSSPS